MESNLGTILIVGGPGFLGSHIVDRLLSQHGHSTIAITSRNAKTNDPRVKAYPADITSASSVKQLFSTVKPTVVIHTASPHHLSSASELHATNVDGTRNLLDAAKACPETRAFVYTSSDSACHPSPHVQITEEQCRLYDTETFNNQYGRSKALADAMVLSANSGDLKTAVIRIAVVYGERDRLLVPQLVASIRKNQHMYQVGSDTKLFELVYVGSAAHAHILAASALVANTPGAAGQAYFITDGAATPFFRFCRKACAAAGFPVKEADVKVTPLWVVQTIASLGEWLYWVGSLGMKSPQMRRQDIDHLDSGCHWSTEKAEKVLGYKPVLEQDVAVERAMRWGMENC